MFFLTSCSTNSNMSNFNLNDEMTFDEFKIKLENYAENNPYPKIDD